MGKVNEDTERCVSVGSVNRANEDVMHMGIMGHCVFCIEMMSGNNATC